jgi:hypothetical protein
MRYVPNCSGGLIHHLDGTVAGCTNDDTGDCAGLEEHHEDAPETCWQWRGRCDRCGIVDHAWRVSAREFEISELEGWARQALRANRTRRAR